MSSNLSLKGLSVLVTRPKAQAHNLCNIINQSGGYAHLFPTLEIIPLINQATVSQISRDLITCDWVIFTSSNAVIPVMQYWPANSTIKVAAIGASTAKCLMQHGITEVVYPEKEFSSAGLLALPIFEKIRNLQVLIFTGENGLGILEKELIARGAKLTKIAVYCRQKPRIENSIILSHWQQPIDIIISTSNESLANLVDLTPISHYDQLLHTPLLVVSQRMQTYAQNLGFKKIILACQASDEEILARLKSWYYEH